MMRADSCSGTAQRSSGRYRLTRDVTVDPLQRVGGGKREHARQHLIQGDAQRVEVAPGIDGSIHAPGLFRGHIGKRAGNDFRRRGRLALARQPGGDAKAGEPHVSRLIDERVCGLHVLMDEALPMDLPKSRRQTDRNG